MAKSFILFDSDSLKDFHKRIFFSMLLFLFVYFVAIYRITQIMIIAPVYKIVQVNETFEERGKIFDRNGNLLATTINSNSLSTNPIKIKNKTELAKKLSSILLLKILKIDFIDEVDGYCAEILPGVIETMDILPHDANRKYRESFSLQRSFVNLGHDCEMWGLGHDNFNSQPDFESYDWIINLENYDETGWVPSIAEVKNPKKILWSVMELN